jgi:fructokinase
LTTPSAPLQVLTLGEILIDLFPAETGRKLAEVSAFQPKPGGAPANVAVAASRLEAGSAFIGKVGDDAFGRHLIEVLDREGVDTRGMRVSRRARTTLAFIAKPDEFSAEFVFYRNPGADLQLRPDELDWDLIAAAPILHTGSLSLVEEPCRSAHFQAVDWARRAGRMISFDVNYRPSLWPSQARALARIQAMLPLAHLVKINEGELDLLTGSTDPAAGAQLLQAGPKLVVVTLGDRGSHYFTAHGQGFVPAFPVQTVDATGCGDAFIAGLLTRLARVPSWPERLDDDFLTAALRYASAVGALTALTLGVIPALPTAAQVAEFLARAGGRP